MQVISWEMKRRQILRQLTAIDAAIAHNATRIEQTWGVRKEELIIEEAQKEEMRLNAYEPQPEKPDYQHATQIPEEDFIPVGAVEREGDEADDDKASEQVADERPRKSLASYLD